MPRMLREMIDSAIAAQPDMRVVATTAEPAELVAAARTVRPSFVILGLDDGDFPDGSLELFAEQPKVKLLGIQADAGHAYLFELRPERRALGEISPAEIVAVIRNAAPVGT